MSAAEKIKFSLGGVKFSADHETTARAVLEHALKRSNIAILPSASPASMPAVGESWPAQGGVYAGYVRGENGQKGHHLIVATDDSAYFKGKYGCYGDEIDGANHKRDGAANTQAMAKAGCNIAKKISALSIDGHQDFYIPSQCELMLCFINVPELFKKEWHWSSTQFSAVYAWCQGFDGGGVDYGVKGCEFCLRAVRRIPE